MGSAQDHPRDLCEVFGFTLTRQQSKEEKSVFVRKRLLAKRGTLGSALYDLIYMNSSGK